MSERGRVFVIAAPSGAGKTSLVKALLAADPNRRFSVSTTTRSPRKGEVNGVDYHFVDDAEFDRLLAEDAFLEHANVFDNRYGTTRAAVEDLCAAGNDVILEIDWQGAAQVRDRLPGCTSIFILPPSRAELERRLRARATSSDETDELISRRLRDAAADISHWDEFDYVVVNDRFDDALAALEAVLAGEGDESRVGRPGLDRLMDGLLAGTT